MANYSPIVNRLHQEHINCIINNNMLGRSPLKLYLNYVTTLNNCKKILKIVHLNYLINYY